MADSVVQIGARMDARLVEQIDRSAREDRRDRTGQLEYLAEIGLAGRRRLKELEQQAVDSLASQNAGTEAARAHLREHRRLGFPRGETE